MPSPDARRTAQPGDAQAQAAIAGLRQRVVREQRRADRAAAIVASYEAQSASGPERLGQLRIRLAVLHRQMETRHRASAALHEAHALRLEAWLGGARGQAFRPVFMTAVAAMLGTEGAVALMRGGRHGAAVVAASGPMARAAHDLEVTLGEGPALAAMDGRAPVAAAGGGLRDRWPLYGPAVTELGVQAVAAVPLGLPAAWLGALCAYSGEPVIRDGLADSVSQIGDVVTHTMLLTRPHPGSETGIPGVPLFDEADYQDAVHQAAGMVSVQYGCSVQDAEALLRARAFADGQPLAAIAESVLRGETLLS